MDSQTLIKRLLIVALVLNVIFVGAFAVWLIALVKDFKL